MRERGRGEELQLSLALEVYFQIENFVILEGWMEVLDDRTVNIERMGWTVGIG